MMNNNIDEIIEFCDLSRNSIYNDIILSEDGVIISSEDNSKGIVLQQNKNLPAVANTGTNSTNANMSQVYAVIDKLFYNNNIIKIRRVIKFIFLLASALFLYGTFHEILKNLFTGNSTDSNGKPVSNTAINCIRFIVALVGASVTAVPVANLAYDGMAYLAKKLTINVTIPLEERKKILQDILAGYNVLLQNIKNKGNVEEYEKALLYKSKIEIALNELNKQILD